MKQIKHTILGILLLTPAILTSCISILGDEDIQEGQDTMEVEFARSSENASPNSGLLIFWQKVLGDFFTAEIEDLETYKSTKFNTGEAYPKDNSMVYATGFSPMDMQYSSNYETLEIPIGSKAGTVDVCTASKKINGNYAVPFNETMSFKHTLTKVTFLAKRHETMKGSKNVDNIKITIPSASKYLPTNWKWDVNEGIYKVNNAVWSNTDLVFEHPNIIFETNTDKVGTAYIMLPIDNNGTLKNINIKADITPVESTVVENHIDITLPEIQLYEDINGTIEVSNAKAGEAYEILIVFQQNSFTLIARQQDDWEKGGLIYVPVKP